jgi:hypothetical protein
MKAQIKITDSYLARESVNPERSIDWISNKGESVKQWVINYCRRNNIDIRVKHIKTSGVDDMELVLDFKSENQADCFIRNGNYNFPYFEFI